MSRDRVLVTSEGALFDHRDAEPAGEAQRLRRTDDAGVPRRDPRRAAGSRHPGRRPGRDGARVLGGLRRHGRAAGGRGGGEAHRYRSGAAAGLTEAAGDFVNNRERAHDWLSLRNSPKPLIAQVQGYCLGVANEIVGCCDLVYCSESARFGMPEVRQGIGLPPTLGFWPLRIGVSRTKELLFTGRLVEGREAARIGLADVVVDSDEVLGARVAELAAGIAETPSDRLAVMKLAADRWADVAGVADAVARGAEFHALFLDQTHAAG